MYCTPEIKLTARTHHRCTWCGQAIEPGTIYTRWMNRDADGAFTNKVHPECMDPLWLECREDMGVYIPFENGGPKGLSPSIHTNRKRTMSYALADTTDTLIHSATADTDCSILIVGGAAIALIHDDDEEVVGYYHAIAEGEYVYNMHDGYSWYVEDGELCSMHGKPNDMKPVGINDGSQRLASQDGTIARLIT